MLDFMESHDILSVLNSGNNWSEPSDQEDPFDGASPFSFAFRSSFQFPNPVDIVDLFRLPLLAE
jgi:hypothetical protein